MPDKVSRNQTAMMEAKKEAVFIFVYQNVQKEDKGRSLIFVYLPLRNRGARH
ncbi:hypothetical protein LRU_01598 [Ligilactobacillus ruminis SPM0211]|uniref:Uncharacterized protein n=1 Tax=Ligilactobacillus ruminis SPM0211 TaxID=1040964 RepID=F7R1M4_9LACO|nr:hypothetical protein LRU_01598 [Ligilactobacillus ruminis SPM0211]